MYLDMYPLHSLDALEPPPCFLVQSSYLHSRESLQSRVETVFVAITAQQC